MTAGWIVIRWTSKGHLGSEVAALLAQSEDFNHCMLIDVGDGCMASEAVLSGVRYVSLAMAMRGVVRFQDMVVHIPDIEAMRAWMRARYGKGYDWFGAVGLPLLRADDWQNDDLWWCSEWILAAAGAGKNWLLDPEELHRVTPNDLRQVDLPKFPYNTPALLLAA